MRMPAPHRGCSWNWNPAARASGWWACISAIRSAPPPCGHEIASCSSLRKCYGEPVIVVGDFNLTPYSPYNDDFLQASGLTDCSQGRALQPTWPVWFPPLWMTIDRCFVTAGIAVAGYRVGPSLGSDHNSLVIDFRP